MTTRTVGGSGRATVGLNVLEALPQHRRPLPALQDVLQQVYDRMVGEHGRLCLGGRRMAGTDRPRYGHARAKRFRAQRPRRRRRCRSGTALR